MTNYNDTEKIIQDNYSETYTSPDDDIVNEQEQNKPLNSPDEPQVNYGKEKAFEEGTKNDTANIEKDADDTIDAGKAKE